MGLLIQKIKEFISKAKLGFIATVCADGLETTLYGLSFAASHKTI
jgi:hypothetical protein